MTMAHARSKTSTQRKNLTTNNKNISPFLKLKVKDTIMPTLNLEGKTNAELKALQKTWEDEISDIEDELKDAQTTIESIYAEQDKRRNSSKNNVANS